MDRPELIPILRPEDLNDFHYKTIEWQPTVSETKHKYYHVNRIEDFFQKLSFPLPPHRKTVHDIIYLKKGFSRRSKGLNKYDFQASQLFFLPAFQITEHEVMSEDVEGYFLHFDDQLFPFLPKNYLNETFQFFQLQSNPVISISEKSKVYIEYLLERLLGLYEDEKELNLNLVATYLLTLFEEIKKELPAERKKTKNAYFQITEQFKNALAQHIYQKQHVADYSKILNISPNYLNKCVKNSTNRTAQDLLNEMLTLEAKTLLKFSNLQISEIAVKLFDQTPSNFSRFFKSQTGFTPKQYLEMY
ncbi:AraC family transcriptional regulator [Arcicella rosea]|uniref:AraC-like DNA-binding protein n=1 Tax=Arcicella rosea TaxID=502909 RepID=A0A841EGZ6_9BACT|nr:helix-turn-helix transcriptional regulator [Arcicella rosea]MBB6002652.1 AraC-like DNA-binding protein [Arcicella rosea]